jgi:cation:H+ antiporter
MMAMMPSSPLVAALMLAVGIGLLALGASRLVDGASRLALRLGVAPIVVGLTVVGFGTSLPELSVSVLAVLRGSGGLSLGNAVGSNIMNLILVLGTAAVLAPIQVVGGRHVLRRDLLFGLVPALVLLAAAWGGHINRQTAAILLVIFVLFMAACVRQARDEAAAPAAVAGTVPRHLLTTAVGIVVLLVGAELMVRGAVSLAGMLGVSEAVIGLSVVAFGTSLPELATSVVASLKGEAEISVGNVLGSNVFNLGLVVGTAFTIRSGPVPAFVIHQDIPILLLVTVAVAAVVLRQGRISRRSGVFFLALFAAYMVVLASRGAAP